MNNVCPNVAVVALNIGNGVLQSLAIREAAAILGDALVGLLFPGLACRTGQIVRWGYLSGM